MYKLISSRLSSRFKLSVLNGLYMSVMSSRYLQNPFQDYTDQKLLLNGKLCEEFTDQVKENIDRLLGELQTGVQNSKRGDFSAYTGLTGIALLYLHLYNALPDSPERQSYLETSLGLVKPALRQLGSGVYTFMCGDAGVLAVAAVAFSKAGDSTTSKECIQRLEGLYKSVVRDAGIPDEHLYGRAGYLTALLYVNNHLGASAMTPGIVKQVVSAMLVSGQAMSKKKGMKPPLMYAWYREYYLGAAHGLAGIMHTLLTVRKDSEMEGEMDGLVRPTLDYMLTLKLPSDNYPAVLGETEDRLVHWCHGAPGWASMWALAYETYKDPRYLEAAESCCDVTWNRGLLKKGYGLCHGAAGNAYAFLALYRLTGHQKHLYRACKFAEWCFDYGKHGCRTPDTPYSLFEGMAGTIYFLADLLDPMAARFPAYEL